MDMIKILLCSPFVLISVCSLRNIGTYDRARVTAVMITIKIMFSLLNPTITLVELDLTKSISCPGFFFFFFNKDEVFFLIIYLYLFKNYLIKYKIIHT